MITHPPLTPMRDAALTISNKDPDPHAVCFMQMVSKNSQHEISSWFGTRVKELRREQNISQSQLGCMIGLDRSSISRIENGQPDVSLNVVFQLAQGLGTTAEQLVAGMRE
jgi:DNA-binding XRE family transcriptional regulator